MDLPLNAVRLVTQPHAPIAQGILKGYDTGISIILVDATERVFSETEGVENVVLGLYIVRGDTM